MSLIELLKKQDFDLACKALLLYKNKKCKPEMAKRILETIEYDMDVKNVNGLKKFVDLFHSHE